MLQTLRSRRYLGLMGACLVVVISCIAAGTWQIARFDEKRAANDALRKNNRDATADVAKVLGSATAPTSTGKVDQFEHVAATGQYLTSDEVLERGQTVGNEVGYVVVTPFRTASGVLLIARGFIAQTLSAKDTPVAPAAPTGTVTIQARLQGADTRDDRKGQLPANQVESINPADQQARLSLPVWNAYAQLLAGQPGTAALTVLPDPDMSNPAGGAEVPQHAAYVVQWYLFAGLALALPFILAAAERRRDAEARGERLGSDKKTSLDDRLAGRT